ncbi:MAG: CRISPR-associated endonuclease Cas1 [Thermodesulfobacteriota bacterium]
MPILYVTEPGAMVRLAGESLVVTLDEDPDGAAGPEPKRRRTLLELEPHRLEMIALVGRANATTDAVMLCLEKGIALAWFSRGGDFLGRLVPQSPRSADLRLLQYRVVSEPQARLERARGVVTAKLGNALEALRDIQSNDSANPLLAPAMAELKRLAGEAGNCLDQERLLGLEGTGAREYFRALGGSFRGEIGFQGRQRRPPPDPANALLSFGYVLMGNRLAGMLEARGLDPALGFYHQVRPGRPSLALDLLEELRHPLVDRFVLRVCNLRILRSEMFEADQQRGGVRLTREGLKVFFREWEKNLQRTIREREQTERPTVLALLRRQVERLAADLRGGEPYRPLAYGG